MIEQRQKIGDFYTHMVDFHRPENTVVNGIAL